MLKKIKLNEKVLYKKRCFYNTLEIKLNVTFEKKILTVYGKLIFKDYNKSDLYQ